MLVSPMLTALDHVVIAVSDLEAAERSYAELLGRSPSWRGVHPRAGTSNVLFRLENTYLELLAGTKLGEGLRGLAFATDDAKAEAARLQQHGIQASDPVEGEGRDGASGAVRRWRNSFLPTESTRGLLLFAIEHLTSESALPRAPATAPAETTVHALDHVVVASDELEAARRLYGDALGLRLALDRRFEARGVRILFFRVGGVTVEVAGPLEPPAAAAPADRFGGLAWRVADLIAARERLAAGGWDVSPVRPGAKPGTQVCSVRAGTAGVPTLLIGPAGSATDGPDS
jgi:catechol 2,3-dioxygenase-like lactoylglutathione lyase family enzyme